MKKTVLKLAVAAMSILAAASFAACLNFGSDSGESSGSVSVSGSASSSSLESSESSSAACKHAYEVKEDVEPSCTAPGSKTYRCSLCEDEYTESYGEALGHVGEWTVDVAAKCESDGSSSRVCTRCGNTETKTDEATGHSYAEDTSLHVDPTCEDTGKMVRVCSGCKDVKETILPASGHTPDPSVAGVKTDATCTEDGYTTYYCSVCEKNYRADIESALEHDLKLKETITVSCLTSGYDRYACEREGCTYEEKRNETDKLPHTFDTDGNCTSGCGKSHTDKSTWVNTKYDVTYNETSAKWSLNGGDPGTEQISHTVTIPARIFQDMQAANQTTFCIKLLKRENTTPIFGYNLTGEGIDWKYQNNSDFTLPEMAITEEMLTDGFTFHALYADLTQRDPAWGATVHVIGFDMTIEFFKAFDIANKDMWLISDFVGGYNTEKGVWSYNGETPQDGNVIQKTITIKADVFKAMAETKTSFKISILRQKEGQTPQFGLNLGTWTYANIELNSEEFAITEDMKQNGLTMTVLYLDNTQQNPAWGGTVDVDGFDMKIEFIDKFDATDPSGWFKTDYTMSYSSETETYTILGGIEQTTALTLRSEVLAYMAENGYTKVSVDFSAITEESPGFDVKGDVEKAQNVAWNSGEIELTDSVKANGITLNVYYRDLSWGTAALTGFNVKVTFTK